MTDAIEALQERIARAICLSKQGRGDSPSVAAQYVDTFWRDYLPEARIAVSAAADALSAKDREMAEAREEIERLKGLLNANGKPRFNEAMRRLEKAERERDEAMAALREKEERVKALEADKARLDFLDACNAALNGRYGTNYGWTLVLTHNVTRLMLGRWMEVDLHDSEGGKAKLPSCRGAIDREMTRIDVERRARSLSSVQPVSGSREQRGNEEG